MTRRVVVTGLGSVTALGDDTETLWQGCLGGRVVVAPIPDAWRDFAEFRSTLWAPLHCPDFEALGFTRLERTQHDPTTLLACIAAREALHSAGLELELVERRSNVYALHGIDSLRCGVFVGTGVGGVKTFMESHAHHLLGRSRRRLAEIASARSLPVRAELETVMSRMAHPARFNPFSVSMLMPSAPAAYLGIKFGLKGENTPIARACASGTAAIGHAYRAIRDGRADYALAGGCEYLADSHGSIFLGFDLCRALVRKCDPPEFANCPFDRDRSGFLFGQGGAAILMLEEEECALRRGARPLAVLSGYAESFDAHSMMSPPSDGAAIERMLRELLSEAGLSAHEVQYINAHGTGTQSNDGCEADVIERVFGTKTRVNSTKSLLGHTIGASGAIEAVVTVLSLRDQHLHPSAGLRNPCSRLNFVRESGPAEIRHAVTQSFAFGGHNAALVFGCATGG